MLAEFAGYQALELDAVQAVPQKWEKLIESYEDIFQEPTGLPPSRGREHAITLEEGAKPVSVRPFRYPQVQKQRLRSR